MDSWLQRLVVRGPAADVTTFRKAAASPAQPIYMTMAPQLRTQKLSFIKLIAALPEKLASAIGKPEEPWDLVMDPADTITDGTIELTYKFQLDAFECELLVAAISTVYPRLCFVLGTVEPSGDEQSSLMAHSGKVWRWRVSNRLKNIITAKIPEETAENEGEVSSALAEADWEMMDAVVEHWKEKVTKISSEVALEATLSPESRRDRRRRSERKPRRSRATR